MDITALKAFIAVAKSRSFSQASKELFVTQPAISKRVAALEEELGAKLFNRVTRNISLTEVGARLLPKAEELVNQAKDMQRVASHSQAEASGRLSIAISHHIGLHRMPPILKQFNQTFALVDLDIQFMGSDRAFNAVERGEIEFAVITLPSQLPKLLSSQVIWQDELNIVIAPDHPLVFNSTINLDDIAQAPCVLPSTETETYQIIQRVFKAQGFELNVQMVTNNLETLKMLASVGLGWSVLPTNMIDASLSSIDVGIQLQRELGLVFHKRRSLSAAASALSDLIEQST